MRTASPRRGVRDILSRTIICVLALVLASPALTAGPTVSYTALSDAARKAGRLARYDKVPLSRGSVKLGDCVLSYGVPRTARAYDVIPIHYRLTQPAGMRRAAVEAVAFEDAKKAKGRALYDLAIPGNMGVRLDYLGSVSADFDEAKYLPLTADPKSPISPFPPYKRDSMVRSSNIRAAKQIWFKFRITNTGDTIFDPEGFGATMASPTITRIGPDGKDEWTAEPVNGRIRHLNYLYPGESVDLWTDFYSPKLRDVRGLNEGDYRLRLTMQYRYHREYNWWTNLWVGKGFAQLDTPIKVTAAGGTAPVESTFKVLDADEKMPGDFDTFEEFMTSLKVFPGAEKPTERKGVIYLQVAPWTRNVVAKLILTDPRQIVVARIPIRVTDETLSIRYNPKNPMVIYNKGKQEPVFIAQAMPGMRTGFQLGPYPEEHMLREIREMKELGVNVIANTSGNWWLGEVVGRKGVEPHSACYKYWYDVLVRKMGMKMEGWSVYPPMGPSWYDTAGPLLGKKVTYSTTRGGYGDAGGSVDLADPIVPEVIAAWTKYHYTRWGDTWFKTKDGRVPISIEDTWGWMRDDINRRYYLGPLALGRFRDWVRAKYGAIEKANAAWRSSYKDFGDIDPQADQGKEGDGLGGEPVYNKKDHPFHDWSPAVDDWDTFRTELRMDVYRKTLELIRKFIPGAEFDLRTEASNIPIPGDGKSDNMHWRHVYYSQRRNAMVQSVVNKANVVHFYSDYTTLPHSEDEWRSAMRRMVSEGITPMFLPQFDHMRDILLNPHFGREYQMHYNLDKPTKGMMVHCLMAAYPCWKATYEEGGAPGIIWSDYLCDGFATETQKRELKLLRQHFDRMPKK